MVPGIVIPGSGADLGCRQAHPQHGLMDAWRHNLEAYCTPASTIPWPKPSRLGGNALVKEYPPRATCQRCRNVGSPSAMLVASSMGASGHSSRAGAIHAVRNPGRALCSAPMASERDMMPYANCSQTVRD